MINIKSTLKNLHEKFPTLSLDDLFTILDCITEEPQFWSTHKNDIQISPYTSTPRLVDGAVSNFLEAPGNYVTTSTNSKSISSCDDSHKLCGGH